MPIMDVKDFLEELFGCQVDLVMKEAIKPRLREPILKKTSMPKDYKTYLEDIDECINKIMKYIA
jgi:hypothetical protein